jgi:hypothetical protein
MTNHESLQPLPDPNSVPELTDALMERLEQEAAGDASYFELLRKNAVANLRLLTDPYNQEAQDQAQHTRNSIEAYEVSRQQGRP